MDKNKDNDVCVFQYNMLKYAHEVIGVGEYDIDCFHKVYKEISEEIGVEAALGIHRMFKGTQVCFPVKFLDTNYIREMIVREYNGKNIKELARKYDYSEKTIRRIINNKEDK